jgi:hypothetical protein
VACGNKNCNVGKRFNGKSKCGIATRKLACTYKNVLPKISLPSVRMRPNLRTEAKLCSFCGAGKKTFLPNTGMALVFESVVANLCRPGWGADGQSPGASTFDGR